MYKLDTLYNKNYSIIYTLNQGNVFFIQEYISQYNSSVIKNQHAICFGCTVEPLQAIPISHADCRIHNVLPSIN